MTRAAAAIVVALAAAGLPTVAADPRALPAGGSGHRALAVGQPAPEIVLDDQYGKPFRLVDLLARRDFVVVAFYVKAFTGG